MTDPVLAALLADPDDWPIAADWLDDRDQDIDALAVRLYAACRAIGRGVPSSLLSCLTAPETERWLVGIEARGAGHADGLQMLVRGYLSPRSDEGWLRIIDCRHPLSQRWLAPRKHDGLFARHFDGSPRPAAAPPPGLETAVLAVLRRRLKEVQHD